MIDIKELQDLQDLAWRSLSGEFKEVVKNYYQYALKHYQISSFQRNVSNTLERLFGTENLTSDAEGENEILCVSRKNVQRMYSYNEDKLSRDPTNKGALLLKLRLDALFGSKCLPDEGTDCTPVELNEDNFAKSELQPKSVSEISEEISDRVAKTIKAEFDKIEPKPAEPKVKRHVSVKEACEMLGVDESEATKLVKSEPIETCTETCTDDCSSPDHFVVKDEMVDNIIMRGFENHNRLHVAAMAMHGILSNPVSAKSIMVPGNMEINVLSLAEKAVKIADVLTAECEKGGSK